MVALIALRIRAAIAWCFFHYVILYSLTFLVTGMLINLFGLGCIHGYPAILIAQFRDAQGMKISATDISWIGSVLGMSKLFGSLLSMMIMYRFGRKKAFLSSTIPAFIGWMVYFCFDSVPFFIVARILHGISLGLRVSSYGILMAEYTDPILRGRFLGTSSVFVATGVLFSHTLGAILTWKMTALVCSLAPLICLLMLARSPESPSWLASRGRIEEASKTFIWLRGDNLRAKTELEEIIQNAETTTNLPQSTWRDTSNIFRNKQFYKPTIVAMSVYVLYEFGGSHIVPSYGNLILQQLLNKEDTSKIRWHLTVLDSLRLLSNLLGIVLMKYINRRTIIMNSGILTTLSLSSISLFIYLRRANMIPVELLDILPMVLIVIYIVSFYSGCALMVWVIVGEVFPLRYRSLGSTVAATILTPSSIVAMKSAPLLFVSVGVEGTFLIFSVLVAACLCIILTFLPETKDRTLQDIENKFKGKQHEQEMQVELLKKNVAVN